MKMNKWLVFWSIVVGLLTIPVGFTIWPPSAGIPYPDQTQFPFFVGIALFEAVGFGAGFYFLIDGYRILKSRKTKLNFMTYISIVWLLMSWWPHDRLHIHVGEEIWGVIILEYVFHETAIIAALIIAKFFYQSLKESK